MTPGFWVRESGFRRLHRQHFDFALLDRLGVKVTRLATDSRGVRPGDTFLAYTGEKLDGRTFISQAVANGANAVLWESRGFEWNPAWRIPNAPVSQLRAKAGVIASRVHGDPSRKLWVVGVTGTNGKTSCTQWIAQAMSTLGKKTAVVGTLGSGFPGELAPGANTTPDPVLLQEQFAGFLAGGAAAVAMEVSSHALEQGRANGTVFSAALFTNLSRDHLDYHGSMEAYGAAKARLFRWPELKHAILNMDDGFGREVARGIAGCGAQVVGYGFEDSGCRIRDTGELRLVRGHGLKVSEEGLAFNVESSWGRATLRSPLVGRFNAANLLAVLTTLLAGEVPVDDAIMALEGIRPVPGRMQRVGGNGKPLVVVDYAHTPDALEKVLRALREVMGGNVRPGAKLICVFGCGGDRDRGKRPLMGKAASRLADTVIITSDNPRSEEPRAIIDGILAGAGANYQVEEDRAAAIFRAIHEARTGDVVLIAGKGHETHQEIKGVRFPFNDLEVARLALEGKGNNCQ